MKQIRLILLLTSLFRIVVVSIQVASSETEIVAAGGHCSTLKCNGVGGSYEYWEELYIPNKKSKCFGIKPDFTIPPYTYSKTKNYSALYPIQCEDGYEAHELIHSLRYSEMFTYFTCCPSSNNDTALVENRPKCTIDTAVCGDWGNDCWGVPDEKMICNSHEYKYMHETGAEIYNSPFKIWTYNYICCNVNMTALDALLDNNATYYNMTELNNNTTTNNNTFTNTHVPQGCSIDYCGNPGLVGGFRKARDRCWGDAYATPMICNSNVYKYPIKLGGRTLFNGYYLYLFACCDTDSGTPPLSKDIVCAEWVRLTIGTIAFLLSLVVILIIILVPKLRSVSFNLYLVGLAIPDATYNCLQMVTGIRSVMMKPPTTYHAFSSIFFFYMAGNIWINTVVVYHIYQLLFRARNARRMDPPSTKLAVTEITLLLVAASGVAILQTYIVSSDFTDYNKWKRYFMVTAIFQLVIAGLPFLYLLYICFRIWRGELLPLIGRTRAIAIYFFRIVIVFFIFWIPSIILLNLQRRRTQYIFMDNDFEEQTKAQQFFWAYASGSLGSLQGIVSSLMVLCKFDIKKVLTSLPRKLGKFIVHHTTSSTFDMGQGSSSRFLSPLFRRSSSRANGEVEEPVECLPPSLSHDGDDADVPNSINDSAASSNDDDIVKQEEKEKIGMGTSSREDDAADDENFVENLADPPKMKKLAQHEKDTAGDSFV